MVTKNYRFADIAFTLQMQYPYLEKQCRSYEVEEPGILIAASDEEIEREDQSGVSSSNGMLESLAVYRKISEIIFVSLFRSCTRRSGLSVYSSEWYRKINPHTAVA